KKKAVVADSLTDLLKKGKEKLEMGNVERLKVCMTDGTEIDDDEILKSCSDGTILHFICESDAEASQEMAEKPSSQRVFSSTTPVKKNKFKQMTLTAGIGNTISIGAG
ncbi:DNA fragmentation factor subunit alpha-like isoform X2, partial [Paramuricea clavata]